MNYTEKTLWEYMNPIFKKHANKEAMVFPVKNNVYTYKELEMISLKVAKGLLALGIVKGDRVAIYSMNRPEWIILQLATARIGAVLVCINSNYGAKELKYILNNSEAKALFMSHGDIDNNYIKIIKSLCPELEEGTKDTLQSEVIPNLRSLIVFDEEMQGAFSWEQFCEIGDSILDEEVISLSKKLKKEEPIVLQYTSGTTGNPKGVLISHYSMLNEAISTGKRIGYTDKDVILLCLPLFHIMGCDLVSVLGLINGCQIVVMERFRTTQALEYMDKYKCTSFHGVPTMYKFIMTHDKFENYDLSHMRKGMIAGSYCSPLVIKEAMDKMNMTDIIVVYGQTEVVGIAQTNLTDPIDKRLTTVGKAIEGVNIKIIDPQSGKEVPNGEVGELCMKSAFRMNGYYKNREQTDKTIVDGWLHTGDLATKDNEGYISIKGRIKEIVVRGGENISPGEIEDLLNSHDMIADATIIGVPDKIMGEEICAVLILKEGCNMSQEEIKHFVRNNLARYKVPKYVEFVKEFPMTSSGKIRKFLLQERVIHGYGLAENAYK